LSTNKYATRKINDVALKQLIQIVQVNQVKSRVVKFPVLCLIVETYVGSGVNTAGVQVEIFYVHKLLSWVWKISFDG